MCAFTPGPLAYMDKASPHHRILGSSRWRDHLMKRFCVTASAWSIGINQSWSTDNTADRVRTIFHYDPSTARTTEAKCDSTPWGRSTLPQVVLAVTARRGAARRSFFFFQNGA